MLFARLVTEIVFVLSIIAMIVMSFELFPPTDLMGRNFAVPVFQDTGLQMNQSLKLVSFVVVVSRFALVIMNQSLFATLVTIPDTVG